MLFGGLESLEAKFEAGTAGQKEALAMALDQLNQIAFGLNTFAANVSAEREEDKENLRNYVATILMALKDRNSKIEEGVGNVLQNNIAELGVIANMLEAMQGAANGAKNEIINANLQTAGKVLQTVQSTGEELNAAINAVNNNTKNQSLAILQAIDFDGQSTRGAIAEAKESANGDAKVLLAAIQVGAQRTAEAISIAEAKAAGHAQAIQEFIAAAFAAQNAALGNFQDKVDFNAANLYTAIDNIEGTTIVCADNDPSVIPGAGIKTACDYGVETGPGYNAGSFIASKLADRGVGGAQVGWSGVGGGQLGSGVGGGQLGYGVGGGQVAWSGVGGGQIDLGVGEGFVQGGCSC